MEGCFCIYAWDPRYLCGFRAFYIFETIQIRWINAPEAYHTVRLGQPCGGIFGQGCYRPVMAGMLVDMQVYV